MIIVAGRACAPYPAPLSSLLFSLYYSANSTALSSPNESSLTAGTLSCAILPKCLRMASDAGTRKFAKCYSGVSRETNEFTSEMRWFFAKR
ncbi:hypothetical protein CsSME_00018735 [Camellia sinensis var. sinensis]